MFVPAPRQFSLSEETKASIKAWEDGVTGVDFFPFLVGQMAYPYES